MPLDPTVVTHCAAVVDTQHAKLDMLNAVNASLFGAVKSGARHAKPSSTNTPVNDNVNVDVNSFLHSDVTIHVCSTVITVG